MGPRAKRGKRAVVPNYSHHTADVDLWNTRQYKAGYRSYPPRDHHSNIVRPWRTHIAKLKDKFVFQRERNPHYTKSVHEIVKQMDHWVKFCSWRFCSSCRLLHPVPLHPSSFNQKGAKPLKGDRCICTKGRYHVPRFHEIPDVLRALSPHEERILSLFDIDIGPIKYAKNGHRIKTGAFELRIREDTVEERIDNVSDPDSQHRLFAALSYLSMSNTSYYRDYMMYEVDKGLHEPGTKIKYWTVYQKMVGLECALWPVLYPFGDWCESALTSQHDSILNSFRCKLLSEVAGYADNIELVQFHYDRWLFKTVSGAVNSGRYRNCSPLKSLENKWFTAGYWRWQNRYLNDATLQFGQPSLFITLSPHESDFPQPDFLVKFCDVTGGAFTCTGPLETFNIVHVLSQLMKGYLSGVNSNTWEMHENKHLLYAKKSNLPGNVQCIFYRFDPQPNRKSIHLHSVIWLKKLSEVSIARFHGSVPKDNEHDAFHFSRLQKSDRPSPSLDALRDESTVDDERFYLKHTKEDKKLNLRAFIDSISLVIKSSMDVQFADSSSLLTQYVVSYTAKMHDNVSLLRSTEANGFQVATPYLLEKEQGEPEMHFAFSGLKMSYTNLTTVQLVPPTIDHFDDHTIVQKYVKRIPEDHNQTLLEYCRTHTLSLPVPKLSDSLNLVGVHYKYIFNDRFFWEYTVVNTPFRSFANLLPPDYHSFPDNLRFFAIFMDKHSDKPYSPDFETFISTIGYNKAKLYAFNRLLKGYILLYHRHLNNEALSQQETYPSIDDHVNLTSNQLAIVHYVTAQLDERAATPPSQDCDSDSGSDSAPNFFYDSDSDDDQSDDDQPTPSDSTFNPSRVTAHLPSTLVDSDQSPKKKFALIAGGPGTGKSVVISHLINDCIERNLQILFVTTGAHLARMWGSKFPDDNVVCDTVHAKFLIPPDGSDPSVNYSLTRYNIIFIDEIGLVPERMVVHILRSIDRLPCTPVVVVAGDPQQGAALDTIAGKTTNTASLFQSPVLRARFESFTLYREHRFGCAELTSLLSVIRDSAITPNQVSLLNQRCPFPVHSDDGDGDDDDISPEHIISAFQQNPSYPFLTVTRRASSYVSNIIISHLFSDQDLLCTVTDFNRDQLPLFKGMRIYITMNINKVHGVVNGESAVILDVAATIILVRLSNQTEHFIVEQYDEDTNSRFYPFIADYCKTISRVQGNNLCGINLWLDRQKTPGAAYVAISRVPQLANVVLMRRISSNYVCPIEKTKSVYVDEY